MIEVKDATLTAENVQVNLKTLYIALYGHGLARDLARQRIVWAVQDGLSPEDKVKLEEAEQGTGYSLAYENRENPCEGE